MCLWVVGGNLVIVWLIGVVEGVDYYYIGEVCCIDCKGIGCFFDECSIVLFLLLGYLLIGEIFNLVCEDVVMCVVIDLEVEKLIFYGVE